MSQFLKKRAKLIYILMFAISLFIFVSSTVYITAYNDTAVDYTKEVKENPNATSVEGNVNLLEFIRTLRNINKNDKVAEASFNYFYGSFTPGREYKENYQTKYDNFNIAYRSMYDFNQKLQTANNSLFYLGLFALAMVAVMCICANSSRRKYYISNLVSGVVCPTATIAFTAVTLYHNIEAMMFLDQYWDLLNWGVLGNQGLPKEKFTLLNGTKTYNASPAIKWFVEGDTSHYSLSFDSLIIYTVFLGVFIVCNGLLIAYTVFRYLNTRKELKLEGLGD